jgi:hypothetical protein
MPMQTSILGLGRFVLYLGYDMQDAENGVVLDLHSRIRTFVTF